MLTAKYNAMFMTFVTILFVFFADTDHPLYSTDDREVQLHGALALQIIGCGYIFYGIGMVMTQALNGAGDTKTPTCINFVCFWLFQIPLAWFLVKPMGLGLMGAFIAMPVAETALALAAWYYFRKGKWKLVKV